ncbi:MAG TPA: DNA alkylation repair protein [Prolixibacteraceae bacterium]|nr:DNA alkylation repair protein [Prolixibacteraceae bacterium]
MDEEYLKMCLTEVEARLLRTPKNAPAQRKLSKQNYTFSNLSLAEQLIIWDYVWNRSTDFWIKIHSFLFCESKVKNKSFLCDSWETIKHWQKSVDNWGHCDGLAKIFTKILELTPELVLEQLEQWNKSTNLWDRRQSLVSLLYFSRTKKIFLPYDIIISFINKLIDDPEYYVQKAVGWSLKELYQVYPEETLLYLETNIQQVSPIAFSATTEKLKPADKEKLMTIRKPGRK